MESSARSSACARTRDLTGDLARREMPNESHLAGQAERAAHRAANLCRDAEGLRGRVGNEDRLDLPAVRESEDEFLGAVLGDVAPDDLGRRDDEALGELGRAARGQVGHAREVGDPALPDPAEHLTARESADGRAAASSVSSSASSNPPKSTGLAPHDRSHDIIHF